MNKKVRKFAVIALVGAFGILVGLNLKDLIDESIVLDKNIFDDIEELFIMADMGVETVISFVDHLREEVSFDEIKTAEDLKEFIKARTNSKLQELGYDGIFEYDKTKAENLEWFYHLTGGLTHTDFFAIRPTDYSKANEGEDWGDLF